ncbi:MAG: STAS domain-containing protein [Solirubrobacteraceae bacterium]
MGLPPSFHIDTLENPLGITIKLAGELDSGTCAALLDRFEQTLPALRGRELVIDLEDVSFIDSSGMRAIIVMERRSSEERIALALALPPAAVTELLQITGIADRVPLAPQPDRAPPSEPFLERVEIALTRDADAPARARAELRQAIAGRLSDPDGSTATLLTSELVTNAVIHPGEGVGGDVALRITAYSDRIRVEVTDAGSGFDPASPPPVKPPEAGGHGLVVVDGLSSRWGTARRVVNGVDVFCVWFELDAGPALEAAGAEVEVEVEGAGSERAGAAQG